MKRAAVIALATVFFYTGIAIAQDSLTINQPIVREIVPGISPSYTLQLNPGDYVAGWVDQQGVTLFAVAFLPDGSRLRNFGGPREGKRQVAFIAEFSHWDSGGALKSFGPPQPWIVKKDDSPAGKIDKHKIKSELLKNERNISVYTPPSYRSDAAPYSLLVLFDEGAYTYLVVLNRQVLCSGIRGTCSG